MTREFTNKLLEMVDECLLDKDTVIMACVKYMSEDEVKDMMHANEFLIDEDDDEYCDDRFDHDDYDDSMDGDHDSAMASAGFGTDEDYGCFGDY
jgi:hypothetical protein